MTIEREVTSDLFGLAGSLPRPGWVILDAAREHRFTGELVFDVLPEVRVYLDRGEIYLAERVTDPPLGPRLVDAGALNAVQLEHGSIRVGDTEHLGRLFERVPSVDRHAVLITAELMNEECVAWVARQNVVSVTSTPYAHHPAGVHRWERPADAVDLQPGDPLPAPQPSASPVGLRPPEPLFDIDAADALIEWDEPSWLDGRPPTVPETAPPEPRFRAGPEPVRPGPDASASERAIPSERSVMETDWIDRFEAEGLPAEGRDPLVAPAELPHVAAEPIDHFELIWPSGEVDEDFGGLSAVEPDRDPDRDRPGLTARVTRTPTEPTEPEIEPDQPSERVATITDPPETMMVPSAPDDDAIGDDVVLAVRRAVASIDTGSLTARRRLVETTPEDDPSRGTDQLMPPGRIAVRDVIRSTITSPSRSVFDEPVGGVDEAERAEGAEVVALESAASADEPERVSALRRLIGGLRRR